MGAPAPALRRANEIKKEQEAQSDFDKERQQIRDEYYAEALARLNRIAAGSGRQNRSLTNITGVDFQNKPKLGNTTNLGMSDRERRLRDIIANGSIFQRVAATIALRALLGGSTQPSAPPTAVTENGTLNQVGGSTVLGSTPTTTTNTATKQAYYMPSGSATKYMTSTKLY